MNWFSRMINQNHTHANKSIIYPNINSSKSQWISYTSWSRKLHYNIKSRKRLGNSGRREVGKNVKKVSKRKMKRKPCRMGGGKSTYVCVCVHDVIEMNITWRLSVSCLKQSLYTGLKITWGKINSHYTVLISMTILFIYTNILFITLYHT